MVKKYQVVLTAEVRQSLRDITDYIRRTESDKRAKHVRQELLKITRRLVSLPNSYPTLLISERTGITYRYVPKWQYKIIFTVEEDVDRVIVIRLFHDKQGPEQLEAFLP